MQTDFNEFNPDIASTQKSKCPTCGADLFYNPRLHKLSCDHCAYEEVIEYQPALGEQDYYAIDTDKAIEEWEGSRGYTCTNCGATTTLSNNQIATKCPFCGAPKVVAVDDQTGIKPTAILPFDFDKEQAKGFYLRWIKSRLLAPTPLKRNFSIDNINGVYVPCWTYDSNTFSNYVGELGKHYTVTVGSGKNKHTEIRTRWFTVSGNYTQSFDDIVIQAGKRITQKILDKIAPYDTNNALRYDNRFMLGFSAERYSLNVDEGLERAKSIMKDEIRTGILSKYHADEVRYLNIDTSYSDVKYKYVLLPVWVCAYKYHKKDYNFYINGVSGKTYGKTPLSPWKLTLLILLGLGLAVGIGYIIAKGDTDYDLIHNSIKILNRLI